MCNRVSRELLESWFTGPQSIKKCNVLPNPYLVLRFELTKASRHLGNGQATASAYANTGGPDGQEIIRPEYAARDESSTGQSPPAVQQAIHAQEGN
ncbi:unnamed protein product [Dibothriocephalus latus]|uniref:Uncharacterized protein n=1 Tax=Dibothriocephalus latus TaxID=60516 RepID=A0A3P7LER1_DIBLA|nr:unnamed protein product [Dibothriocephalus latus]